MLWKSKEKFNSFTIHVNHPTFERTRAASVIWLDCNYSYLAKLHTVIRAKTLVTTEIGSHDPFIIDSWLIEFPHVAEAFKMILSYLGIIRN